MHRAGGIMGILGELDRAGLLHRSVPTVHAKNLGEAIDRWDVVREHDIKVHEFSAQLLVAFHTSRVFAEPAF